MAASQKNGWFTSTEAQKALRISSCHLMHLRDGGQLKFEKKGNAFLYAERDVLRLQTEQSRNIKSSLLRKNTKSYE